MLRPAGWLYGKIADLRNLAYDRGLFASHDLGARTISVGNMTTGGTGKTPIVAYVAKLLADNGETVCILTRGYGRDDPHDRVLVSDGTKALVDTRKGGDEPVELARQLIGKAIVLADADRVAAARWAHETYDVTTFVLDDGFQHRRANRDLDIVCIDATDPFSGGRMLPAGRLREALPNIRRADAVIITRADQVTSVNAIQERIRHYNPHAAIFVSETIIVELTAIEDFENGIRSSPGIEHSTRATAGEPLRSLAFCGLGNPEAFFSTVRSMSGQDAPTAERKFPDHHRYTQADIESLQQQARDSGAAALITTAKDAVKLTDLRFDIPCFVAEIDVRIDHRDAFRDLVLST